MYFFICDCKSYTLAYEKPLKCKTEDSKMCTGVCRTLHRLAWSRYPYCTRDLSLIPRPHQSHGTRLNYCILIREGLGFQFPRYSYRVNENLGLEVSTNHSLYGQVDKICH